MTIFHISDGEARRCRASKGNCPYGANKRNHITRAGILDYVAATGQTVTLKRDDYEITYRKNGNRVSKETVILKPGKKRSSDTQAAAPAAPQVSPTVHTALQWKPTTPEEEAYKAAVDEGDRSDLVNAINRLPYRKLREASRPAMEYLHARKLEELGLPLDPPPPVEEPPQDGDDWVERAPAVFEAYYARLISRHILVHGKKDPWVEEMDRGELGKAWFPSRFTPKPFSVTEEQEVKVEEAQREAGTRYARLWPIESVLSKWSHLIAEDERIKTERKLEQDRLVELKEKFDADTMTPLERADYTMENTLYDFALKHGDCSKEGNRLSYPRVLEEAQRPLSMLRTEDTEAYALLPTTVSTSNIKDAQRLKDLATRLRNGIVTPYLGKDTASKKALKEAREVLSAEDRVYLAEYTLGRKHVPPGALAELVQARREMPDIPMGWLAPMHLPDEKDMSDEEVKEAEEARRKGSKKRNPQHPSEGALINFTKLRLLWEEKEAQAG